MHTWIRAAMLAALMIAIPASVRAQCRAADAESDNMLAYLRELVTATDQTTVTRRQGYGLSVVSASKVSLVTRARICQDALAAYNAALPAGSTPATSVYVIDVGDDFVVWAARQADEHWGAHIVFDAAWQVKAKFAG